MGHGYPAGVGTVTLTFDDGPDPVWTPRVLAALEAAGAPAAFFPIAARAAAHPGLVEHMLSAGHRVELHCYRHVRHTESTRGAIVEDTRRALAVLDVLGAAPVRWRPPWGLRAPWTRDVARAHGLGLCRWSVDTRDWTGRSSDLMLRATAPLLAPGAVVLMHDAVGPGSRRDGCPHTVELVARLVALARSRGLEPVPDLPAAA
jgi:peptidoglycan/xylan/chitin deacetylase (PgdA/CDA1 family)